MSTHITVLVGAARPDNRTTLVAREAARRLEARGATVELLALGELGLPLPGTGADAPGVQTLRARLKAADGVVLATPEYQGSFSSLLKLALEHLGWPAELSGRPVGLLGVAAGRIGAIKSLEHLRSVCAHLGAWVLPQPVSIAQVDAGLDDAGQLCREGDQAAVDQLCAALLAAAGPASGPANG